MIPRTTIDEANKHISGLHKKVYELESLSNEQHTALLAKDDLMKEKLNQLESAKNLEIDALQEKLESKERTVTILQEQMSQKNQQIAALQKNIRNFKRIFSFKSDLAEMISTITDSENCLKSSAFADDLYDDDTHAEGDSGIGTSIQYFSHLNGSSPAIDETDQLYHSSAQSPRKQHRRNSKGKEFYL